MTRKVFAVSLVLLGISVCISAEDSQRELLKLVDKGMAVISKEEVDVLMY